MSYQNILVTTAFSEECERTLKHAKWLATSCNAKLHLVHFIEPLPAAAFTYASAGLIDEQRIQAAKEKLAQIAKELEIPAENFYLEESLPKAGIVNLAKKLQIDLTVIGNHKNGFLASIIGCTANSVLHHSICDVLIVK
ncbi:MAG: universal stress protein [Gammaproteobacteria bacterium]|nr:universal stress protein [Gammaproteobacteria bacterium]